MHCANGRDKPLLTTLYASLMGVLQGWERVASGFVGVKAASISQADAGIVLARMQAVKGSIDAKRLGSCNTEALERLLGHTLRSRAFSGRRSRT